MIYQHCSEKNLCPWLAIDVIQWPQFYLFASSFQFYVPEVLGVEEVEDELDAIAKAEFEKLEKKLEEKRLEEEKKSNDQWLRSEKRHF